MFSLILNASVNEIHFVKSRGESGRVLVPQPTNDPHDPLNWSTTWKITTVVMASLYTLIQPATQVSIGPIFTIFIEEWNITFTQCANFGGVTVLSLGFINFLWVPLAESFGRRSVFIASLTVILGANIWHALASSYHSFLGSSVLEGLGGGPVETLFPMIISDVIFLSDRGKYVTLYLTTLFSSLMLSPVISAAMAQTVGWRNFYWMNVGLRGVLIAMAVFFMPETKWRRGSSKQAGALLSILPSRIARTVQRQPSESEKKPDSSNRNGNHSSDVSVTKAAKDGVEVSHDDENGVEISHEHEIGMVGRRAIDDPIDEYLAKGRPSKDQFKLWSKPDSLQDLLINLARDFLITFKVFCFPIVAFGGFSFAWSAALFGYVNFGQSQLFSQAPYNFSVLQIGFTNFSCFVGALVGLATAGPLSDWIAERSTKRNRGIREPEMRLPALVPYVILAVIGQVISAVGSQNQWGWEPIVIVGYFFTGMQVSSTISVRPRTLANTLQVTAIPGITMTYATDCYKPITGQIYLAATVVKNMWGYGISQYLNNWNASAGYVIPTMFNTTLFVFFNGICAFILWVWGKKVRGWTRNDAVHRMH